MTMIGKSWPVRAAALRRSSANRCSSPDTSLAGTECLDIFSPAPGDRDVISQVLRDSSIETKIAPRSVRIAACGDWGAPLDLPRFSGEALAHLAACFRTEPGL